MKSRLTKSSLSIFLHRTVLRALCAGAVLLLAPLVLLAPLLWRTHAHSGGVDSFLGIPYASGEPHIVGQAQAIHALFNLTSIETGPFPSDWFTVADGSQNTQRRVNLPMPDCLDLEAWPRWGW